MKKGNWLKHASKKIFDPTALLDTVRICWQSGAEGNKTHTHTNTHTFVRTTVVAGVPERAVPWKTEIAVGM